MLRDSQEMTPDCRKCFNLPTLIAKLATLQAVYAEAYPQFERRSEAESSPAGLDYKLLEGRMLDVLELATFCLGRMNDQCLMEELTAQRPNVLALLTREC